MHCTKAASKYAGIINLGGVPDKLLPHLGHTAGLMLLPDHDKQTEPYRRQVDRGDMAGMVTRLILVKFRVLPERFEILWLAEMSTDRQGLLDAFQ